MHVLDPDRTDEPRGRSDGADADEELIDLSAARDGRRDPDRDVGADGVPTEVTVPPRRGLVRIRGMRVRRIRVGSVAKVAAVFFAIGYLAVLASAVLAWNLANQLGLVSNVEEMVVTSLGVDTFEVAGAALFEVFATVSGVLALFGYVVTVLLVLIYNAATTVLGGVALETGPLRRPRRVFSLRHRRFVTVS